MSQREQSAYVLLSRNTSVFKSCPPLDSSDIREKDRSSLWKLKGDLLCSFTALYFLFWDSTIVALHDSQFKKLLIYLILALYAAPQFSLWLKQPVLGPVSLRAPSWWAHSVLIGQRLHKQTVVAGFHFFFLLLYSKRQLLKCSHTH